MGKESPTRCSSPACQVGCTEHRFGRWHLKLPHHPGATSLPPLKASKGPQHVGSFEGQQGSSACRLLRRLARLLNISAPSKTRKAPQQVGGSIEGQEPSSQYRLLQGQYRSLFNMSAPSTASKARQHVSSFEDQEGSSTSRFLRRLGASSPYRLIPRFWAS